MFWCRVGVKSFGEYDMIVLFKILIPFFGSLLLRFEVDEVDVQVKIDSI